MEEDDTCIVSRCPVPSRAGDMQKRRIRRKLGRGKFGPTLCHEHQREREKMWL